MNIGLLSGCFFLIAILLSSMYRCDYNSGGKDERTDRWFGIQEIACEGGYMPLQCFNKMESKYGNYAVHNGCYVKGGYLPSHPDRGVSALRLVFNLPTNIVRLKSKFPRRS